MPLISTNDYILYFRTFSSKDPLKVTIETDGCQKSSGKNQQVDKLEHVLLKVKLDTERRGDIRITLISPAGTRYVLVSIQWRGGDEMVVFLLCPLERVITTVGSQAFNWRYMHSRHTCKVVLMKNRECQTQSTFIDRPNLSESEKLTI